MAVFNFYGFIKGILQVNLLLIKGIFKIQNLNGLIYPNPNPPFSNPTGPYLPRADHPGRRLAAL